MDLQNNPNNILKKRLDDIESGITALKKSQDITNAFIRNTRTQKLRYPVPKPSQKDIGRCRDAGKLMKHQIELENSNTPDDEPKHVQFPPHLSTKQINKDAVRVLEPIMYRHMDEYIGYLTFEKVRDQHRKCYNKVMLEAGVHPQLCYFHQAAGDWAIEMLISERMKTIMKSVARVEGNSAEADYQSSFRAQQNETDEELHRNNLRDENGIVATRETCRGGLSRNGETQIVLNRPTCNESSAVPMAPGLNQNSFPSPHQVSPPRNSDGFSVSTKPRNPRTSRIYVRNVPFQETRDSLAAERVPGNPVVPMGTIDRVSDQEIAAERVERVKNRSLPPVSRTISKSGGRNRRGRCPGRGRHRVARSSVPFDSSRIEHSNRSKQ